VQFVANTEAAKQARKTVLSRVDERLAALR
jgi:hypothetical protein